jgi:hypothetical protein
VYKLEQGELRLDEMDEAIFQLDGIVDYEVSIERQGNITLMDIGFWSAPGAGLNGGLALAIGRKLREIPSIREPLEQGVLRVNDVSPSSKKLFPNPIKHKIKRVEDAQEH